MISNIVFLIAAIGISALAWFGAVFGIPTYLVQN